MILVVRAELAPLLVELLNMRLQRGQREWVKAARCARRGSAPALGLCLGRPGRARADPMPQTTA